MSVPLKNSAEQGSDHFEDLIGRSEHFTKSRRTDLATRRQILKKILHSLKQQVPTMKSLYVNKDAKERVQFH